MVYDFLFLYIHDDYELNSFSFYLYKKPNKHKFYLIFIFYIYMYMYTLNRNEIFLRLIHLLNAPSKDISDSVPFRRLAAVLVIIHYNNNVENVDEKNNDNNKIPHILLTKRSSTITAHANEVSFPGGSFDKASDASLADTAIRETKEEIDLHFQKSDLIGHLPVVRTLTSNFIIYPFVTLQDKTLIPTILTDEVQDIIDAPLLETLQTMDKDNYYRYNHNSSLEDVYKFTYRSEIIWGATARILKQLYDCLCIKHK
jgi:8-oxo-dGTP pyrophosphatase MutT (NUDIX family)